MNIIFDFDFISRQYSSPETQHSQIGIVLKYAYFQTVCTHNNASVEWSYFAQKCIKFHLQPSTFEKLSPGEKPRTPAYRGEEEKTSGGEGVKGFLHLTRKPSYRWQTARRESLPKIAPIRRAYNVVADNTGLPSFV